MQLRWSAANRCRADARVTRLLSQPGRNSPQFKQTSFVSQQHWTTHSSTQMQPRLWNKASLPCGTVPLYCHCSSLHCCPWMSLVVISHDGIFSTGDTWSQKWVMITDTSIKHPGVSANTDTHAQECSRTGQQKLEGWNSRCMSSLRCISQHFLFAQL